ncbi:unnamed protein product [Aphanomyces euteiches]
MDGYNTILEYIAETSHSDQKVARVLGGWQQPTQMIEPAKLEAVGAKATQQQAFARRLFANYMSRLQKESLFFALAAVLLLYYSDTHSTCPRHVVHDTMVTACTVACGLTEPDDAEELCECGVAAYASVLYVKMWLVFRCLIQVKGMSSAAILVLHSIELSMHRATQHLTLLLYAVKFNIKETCSKNS